MDDKAYKKAFRKHMKNKRPPADHQWSPFRAAEKRYKARFPPPDLRDVLDLSRIESGGKSVGKNVDFSNELKGNAHAVHTRPIRLRCEGPKSRCAYVVPQIPGLVILPEYLAHDEQRSLIRWSLSSQARAPNDTNLDIHYHLPAEGLWNIHTSAQVEERTSNNRSSSKYIIEPKRPTGPEPPDYPPEGPRPLIDNIPVEPSNFDTVDTQAKPPLPPSSHLPPIFASKLLLKLRWANIGYFYHWGTKTYDFTKPKAEYPHELRKICKDVVASIDWQQVWDGVDDEEWGEEGPDWEQWPETYEPDAGIVNFYQPKDTLCGHVDRSEVCATSPLVSISLGNAAIFLIGGLTRSVEPIPILLRSGDIIVMSGPGCRRAYHGVPRILENTLPMHLRSASAGEDDWQPFAEYLQTTRINVNVRQVFPSGFDPLARPGTV
ncbi:hypothetical protein JB92DRAFT_2920854 [Gautieria morchelliformis]|nr:hypothetical protein JB92DRAFT_2920854 [Gautieria morchelliformis]